MLDSLIRRFTNKMARVLFRINAVYALTAKISSLGFKTLQDDSDRLEPFFFRQVQNQKSCPILNLVIGL